jgi:beta-lactamase regulating signal transducer with metallopeptidase domain
VAGFLYTVLTNAVLAAVLALLVAGVSYFCRRPALVHSLWLLVLLKLITPPFLHLPVSFPNGLDLRPDGGAGTDVERTQASGADERRDVYRDVPGGSLAVVKREKIPAALPRPMPAERPALEGKKAEEAPRDPAPGVRPDKAVQHETSSALAPAPSGIEQDEPAWPKPLLTVWLTGSLAWWSLAAYRIGRFRRWCREAVPAPAAVQAEGRELARRLGLARCPAIAFVSAPISPLLWALGGPACLLFPAGLYPRLTPEQRQTLLVHELAHLRRRDHWVRLLELLLLGLYWWHPVVWWARHELREAEEQCCDAWVVWALPAAAPAYATALVETVAFLSQAWPLPLAASGIGHFHTLKRRLTMILRGTPPRALSGAGFLAVLALGALLLPLLPTRADDTPGEEPAEKPAARKKIKQATPVRRPAAQEPAEKPIDPPATPRKTQVRPAADESKSAAPRTARDKQSRAEQVEDARDEVELLEAQVHVKRAELKEAQVRLKQALVELKRLKQLKGAANAQDIDTAQGQVEVRQAQLEGKEALLREADLRWKHAKRRLARLEKRRAKEASHPDRQRTGTDDLKESRLSQQGKNGLAK